MQILYLDFDGVVHVDSVYRTRNGIELLHCPGHTLFEYAGLLEEALVPFPEVRIVLSTSWQLLPGGYAYASSQLPAHLKGRCIGGTFHRRTMRKAWFESTPRPEQVILDIERRKPGRWLAIDDAPDEWPSWAQPHVVRTDPMRGLGERGALEEFREKLQMQFAR